MIFLMETKSYQSNVKWKKSPTCTLIMSGNNLNPLSACKINRNLSAEYENCSATTDKYNYVQYMEKIYIVY